MPDLRLDYARQRPKSEPRVAPGIRVRRVGKLHGLTVWIVDGERLRNEVDVDYVCGGNSARYSYCPRTEIWLDQNLSPTDATATLLHEYVEYRLMVKKGLSYEDAHDRASEAERILRGELAARPPKKVDLRVAKDAVKRLSPSSRA